jgi:hypothetical protein
MNEVLQKLVLVIVVIPFFFSECATTGSSLISASVEGDNQNVNNLLRNM